MPIKADSIWQATVVKDNANLLLHRMKKTDSYHMDLHLAKFQRTRFRNDRISRHCLSIR
jgi:hypothetical protein